MIETSLSVVRMDDNKHIRPSVLMEREPRDAIMTMVECQRAANP
jgi:hypothetical protein